MKKLFPLIFLAVIGCTSTSDLEMVVNPSLGLSTGFYQVALLVEMNSNFSSLLYDKTKEDVESFDVRPYQILPEGASYFIMPVMFRQSGETSYDDELGKMVSNYMRMNHFGNVVKSPSEADYVIVTDVRESLNRSFGKNISEVDITIVERDETPVFFSRVKVQSKSDNNFYYMPSKRARPVRYLTLKGFEQIFEKGLPKAFTEG